MRIIRRFLKSGVIDEGIYYNTTKGTPQGGVISPLLANIVLDILDKELVENGFTFVRYADDFIIMAKSRPEIEKAEVFARSVIEQNLGLELAQEKITHHFLCSRI